MLENSPVAWQFGQKLSVQTMNLLSAETERRMCEKSPRLVAKRRFLNGFEDFEVFCFWLWDTLGSNHWTRDAILMPSATKGLQWLKIFHGS